MRQLALTGTVLLAATVFVLVRGAPYDDVELRSGGLLLYRGQRVGLETLRRQCTDRDMVTLRVGEDVPWDDVQWVVGALQLGGVRRVRFEGAADAVLGSDYWRQDARGVPNGHYAGKLWIGQDDLGDPDLPTRLRTEAAGIDRRLRALVHLSPPDGRPYSVVAPALRACREAGLELELLYLLNPVELPNDAPMIRPEVPAMPVALVPFFVCTCRNVAPGIDLAVADMAELDRGQESDDRLVLQIDREGNVFFPQTTRTTLDDLAAALRTARERYDLKMRQQGKTGSEENPDGGSLSKLYVLICADRHAPARHVGWILHVLAEEGFYKVQYAVWRGADADPGPCMEKAKIQVWLPTDNLPEIVSGEEPTIHVYVGPDRYGVDAARDLDVGGLRGPLAEHFENVQAKPGGKTLAALHVAPDVAWERVVGAINEIARAGIEKIDFRGLPPADEATRRMVPAPR